MAVDLPIAVGPWMHTGSWFVTGVPPEGFSSGFADPGPTAQPPRQCHVTGRSRRCGFGLHGRRPVDALLLVGPRRVRHDAQVRLSAKQSQQECRVGRTWCACLARQHVREVVPGRWPCSGSCRVDDPWRVTLVSGDAAGSTRTPGTGRSRNGRSVLAGPCRSSEIVPDISARSAVWNRCGRSRLRAGRRRGGRRTAPWSVAVSWRRAQTSSRHHRARQR